MTASAAAARSPDKEDSQARHMLILQKLLGEMDPRVPLEKEMMSLLELLSRELGFTRAFLAIVDPDSDSLKLSLAHGPDSFEHVTYGPESGVLGHVFTTGKSEVVSRMAENASVLNVAFRRTLEEMASLSYICVPVVAPYAEAKEVLGTLSVDLPLAEDEALLETCRFLEVVASLIANRVAKLQEDMAMQKHLLSQGLPPMGPDAPPPGNFVAASKSMRMVLRQARQVGPSRATVLVRGESGTGKELLAEAIHSASPRKNRQLVKLNCASLPSELVESELFGHQKGSFTGAFQTKKGLFEVADEGTLFLDEIGELSMDAQAKVLRAIQEKEIQRVGSEKTIAVDVRLICATHQPLEELLKQGRFREDLYYRINVFPVFIPPLRERREDILPLADHFLLEFAGEYAKPIKRISTPAIDLLTQYHWPGNVRELRNCLERAVLLCEEEVIRTYHLPPTLQTAESSATDTSLSFGEAVAKFEQELLVEALKKARGNMLQAARDLRVSYRIVNYKVKKYRIDVKKFSTGARQRKKK